jgi:ankyrin repeat protein
VLRLGLLLLLLLLLQDGVQPLHICAEKGHREVAAVLITAGAAPNTKDAVSSSSSSSSSSRSRTKTSMERPHCEQAIFEQCRRWH